jgi:hypothetical protein
MKFLYKKIIFYILLFIISFLFLEIMTRLLFFIKNNDHCSYRFGMSHYKSVSDELLGYLPEPGFKRGCRNELYSIDSYNYRNYKNYNYSDSEYLIVGDSFGFGDEVNDDETISFFLENMINKKILNAAVYGYGLDQALLRAQKEINKNNKLKKVLLIISYGGIDRTTLSERNGVSKPYFRTEGETVKLVRPQFKEFNYSTRDTFLLKSYFFYNFLRKLGLHELISRNQYTGEDENELSCLITKKFNKDFSEKKVKLYVILFRSGQEVALNNEIKKNRSQIYLNCLNSNKIEHIDTFNLLKLNLTKSIYFSKNHGHPTSYGQKLVSELIYEKIFRNETKN